MSFADDVSSYQIPRAKCSVGVWRSTQDEQTQTEFDALMRSDAMNRAIWRAMETRGYTSTEQALRRHRRGDCKCPSPVK